MFPAPDDSAVRATRKLEARMELIEQLLLGLRAERRARIKTSAGEGGSATYFGKLGSDLTSGSTGSMVIWVDGSATGDSVTVRNRTGQTLKAAILLQATQGIGCTEYLAGPYEMEECA